MQRYLVVNADDFGYSPGVNRGIVDAHEFGIVTSASLMVRKPDGVDAALYCRDTVTLGVGLHIDLGEWAFQDEGWRPLYQVVNLKDVEAVDREVSAQISAFRDLLGRDPTHLDSHQNVHVHDPARSIVLRHAREMSIPVRYFDSRIDYCGSFYGQTAEGAPLPEAISVRALIRLLAGLGPGLTELACHPGYGPDLASVYASEREEEVRTLCDSEIRARLAEFDLTLTSFRTLSALTS
jgi:chitin disaccharide deacetylase